MKRKKPGAGKKRDEARRSQKRRRSKKRGSISASTSLPAAELVLEAVEHHKGGRLDEAEAGYRAALEKEPDLPDALNLLGMIILDAGDSQQAARLFGRAAAAAPEVAQYHLNLGNAHSVARRYDRAVAALEKAARLDPSSLAAHYNLGLAQLSRQQNEEALVALGEVLRIDPEHPRARFLVTALSGEHCDNAPAEYIADLFDDYAETFDQHLTGILEYRAPEELRRLIESSVDLEEGAWNIIDLGCGTGLCGPIFRDVAHRMVGSDLSSVMIEKAREKDEDPEPLFRIR